MFFLSFQSTHSRGVRLIRICTYDTAADVSIHALTRSATIYVNLFWMRYVSFNPRTHEECDCTDLTLALGLAGFNPRTHEECDLPGDRRSSRKTVSIHALTRSATMFQRIDQRFAQVSIHALTRSATMSVPSKIMILECFNPRTHEECDWPWRMVAY